MRYLALLLLAPVLLVLAWIYWRLPERLPRTAARRRFDMAVLLLAAGLGAGMALHGFAAVPERIVDGVGRAGIWKQVLPVLYGYGTFCAVLALGLCGRFLLFRRPRG